MSSLLIDLIGYSGTTINLFSMSLKGERKLRLFSLIANSIYIAYGILIGATPIIIGSAIAVLLHTYRLRKIDSS